MNKPVSRLLTWMKAQSRSLVARLILLAIFMVLFGFLIRIVILIPFIKDKLAELSASRQLSIAEYVAKDIDDKIKERLSLLENLAARFPQGLLRDTVRLGGWLQERHETYPKFSNGLIVVARDGKGSLGEYPVRPGRGDLDFSQSDWFQMALKDKRPVMGRPTRGRASQEPLIIMAAPILDSRGRVLAVLAGVTAIAAPGFLSQLQETHIGKTGGFLLISPKDNLFVAATKPEMVLKPLPKPGANLLHDKAMAGYRGTGITINAFGVEELSAMVSVPSTGWFLVARLPTKEAFALIDETKAFLFKNMTLIGLFAVFFLLYLLPRVFRQLTVASRQIHRMAEGEIALQPVPVVSKDEVGNLVEGFNILVKRLEETTDQKQAEQRLRLSERERMEASLRQWMTDTSHELRTPVSVIRAQIEAIQDGIHKADAQTLDVLHRETMGLSHLIDDLYALARSDVGCLDILHVPLAPLDILEEVVSAFSVRFAEAGLALDWAGRPGQRPIAQGDPARLKQVFSNLLENTLRYTDCGGRLRIESAILADRLLIYFDDTPPGVPEEALAHLFDRFFRVDASRSREQGGSGIGLAVSLSLVEAMGGNLKAQHSDLGGVRMVLSLPCKVGETA
ncbi:MAG: HAMP domain-containing protein [Alphaproteobacteria bacterium]|nr:HAMP domain-containing protein [Alphaproteobacteria bacterium]